MRRMEVGQIVDYVLEWNEIHDPDKQDGKETGCREATQADWDAFWG